MYSVHSTARITYNWTKGLSSDGVPGGRRIASQNLDLRTDYKRKFPNESRIAGLF